MFSAVLEFLSIPKSARLRVEQGGNQLDCMLNREGNNLYFPIAVNNWQDF